MMGLYEILIEVWGNLPFPLDMLRYDNCTPYSQGDAAMIEASLPAFKAVTGN